MKTVRATSYTLDVLFERCVIPYPLRTKDGDIKHIEMVGFRCRNCKWETLPGVNNLPFAHECEGKICDKSYNLTKFSGDISPIMFRG